MSLSNCEKCWSSPCDCGYEYRNYSIDKMYKLMSSMLSYFSFDEKRTILNRLRDRFCAIEINKSLIEDPDKSGD